MFVLRLRYPKKTLSRRSFSKFSQVRVRFAPSPTGFLHLGGLRTALYNYLFAKSQNGKFILRIEDTDQSRLVEGSIEQLQCDLSWVGIEINEGPRNPGDCGPYIQSQRLQIYRDHVEKLLKNGSAYYCFCTSKRLDLLRKEALRLQEIPKYDNRCRHLSQEEVGKKFERGEQSCIRFKLNSGLESFNDLIYGPVSYDITANEGDPVIMKSDGFPTYHFANVVDDHSMEISHVLRGVEWQISTTKHILLYRAFNWEPPKFGHLPLLLNSDGSKLSKRQNDIKISHYRENGILPLAIINYIVNSGGGFEKDSKRCLKPKCYTIQELTEQFDISRINAHSGKLMPERLLEFNRLELKRRLQDEKERNNLIQEVRDMLQTSLPNESLETSSEHIESILKWSVNRISKLSDLTSKDLKFIWMSPKEVKIEGEDINYVKKLINVLTQDDLNLNREALNSFFRKFCEDHQIKFSKFMKMLRSVLSGLKEGPSVAEMVEILGKDSTVRRLELSIKDKEMR